MTDAPKPPGGPLTTQDLVHDLLKDAILVQTYLDRIGASESDALARAVVAAQNAPAEMLGDTYVELSKAFSAATRRLRPLTLPDLRSWIPAQKDDSGQPPKRAWWKYAFIGAAILLLVVSGHFTAWHKQATKLLADTIAVTELTRSDLLNDMVDVFAEGGTDLTTPGNVARIPFRQMVDELRLVQLRIDQNIAQNKAHESNFVPFRAMFRKIVHDYRDWRGVLNKPRPEVMAAGATAEPVEQAIAGMMPMFLSVALGSPAEGANLSDAPLYRQKCAPEAMIDPANPTLAGAYANIGKTISGADAARQAILCFAGVDPSSTEMFLQANWIYNLGQSIDLLSVWILPALYGALGAVMYFLRDFLDRMRPDPGFVEVAVRVALGMFAGVSVGWFAAPTTMVQGIGIADLSLATLTLAFLVGFGIDVFFSLLDKMLELFRGSIDRIGTSGGPPSGTT